MWTYPVWEAIRHWPELVESAAAWSSTRFNLATGGEKQFIDGYWPSGSLFETLGVQAAIGRTLTDADDRRGGGADGPVAVISYSFWQRRFGGAADAVGRSLPLSGVPFTIVGVTPPGFFGPDVGRTFDVMVPVGDEPLIRGRDTWLDNTGTSFLTVVARLRPGQSADSATAALRAVQPQIWAATIGETLPKAGPQGVERYLKSPFTVTSGATGYSGLRDRYARPLLVIMAIVALLLLIACMNIANLLLARAASRRPELSLRLALGASRWRLVRQLLTESVMLSSAGSALGLVLAAWSSRLLVHQFSTATTTVFLDLSIDVRILAFTAGIGVATALLFGTIPAFRASRIAPMDALKQQGRTTTGQARGALAGWLVVAQLALSVVLVVAAGLLARTFTSLAGRPLGFQPDSMLVVTLDTQGTQVDPPQRLPLLERARDAVRALPSVAGAAVSYVTPVSNVFAPPLDVAGVPANDARDVFGNLISPGWFNTFGIALVAGRDFSDGDRQGAPRVAVVNETFARRFASGENPIGRTITLYPRSAMAIPSIEIVGVVADAVYASLRAPVPPTWYMPLAQFDPPGFTLPSADLSIRSKTGSPVMLTRSVAAALAAVNPQVALTFRPLADRVNASLTQERLIARLAGGFGGLALLLSGLGLYGVTAYAVSRRRAEIAIRMALGAAPAGVARFVLSRVSLLVGAGVALGGGLSLWAAAFVAPLLYGLEPRDPATLGAAAALSAVGGSAGWMPAWRGSGIDPAEILRES